MPDSLLSPFLPLVRDSAYVRALQDALARGAAPRASAIDAARPALAAALHGAHGRTTLLVTARPGRARQRVEELREALRARMLDVRVGTRVRIDRLLETLVGLGYTRVPLVENPGEFAHRGGIVDLFPAVASPGAAMTDEQQDEDEAPPLAVRLDFFG